MSLSNTNLTWGSIAKGFHWIIAALIFTQFGLGWIADEWPRSPTKVDLFVWHKSIGILILTLVVLRICWRMLNRVPDLPAATSRMERWGAHASHAVLYLLIVAMPISGWVINSAANFPLKLFWLVPLPNIVAPSKATQTLAANIHLGLFWTLATVVTIHIAAALRHHFVKRDDVLIRMLPGESTAVDNEAK